MTEFALIVPVFLVIVAGLLGFGRVFFYWIEANHLANETARWAVVDRNPYGPGQTLQQHAASGTTEYESDVEVCLSFPDGGTPAIGNRVRIEIAKPFNFVPILGIAPITIRGSSTMRIERFATSSGNPSNYAAGDQAGASC